MKEQAIIKHFLQIIDEDKNMSNGIAAIKTLLTVLEKTNCKFRHISIFFIIRKKSQQICAAFSVTTIQELVNTIKSAVTALKNSGKPITSVCSASELFICFITLSSSKLEDKKMDEVKSIMLNRGQIFLKKLQESRHVIAKHAVPFINDGCVRSELTIAHFRPKSHVSFLF